MASFDWPRFLARHNVKFVSSGSNTGRGYISVRCPWCGESDPSEHLGIALNGHGYHCWRSDSHSGRSRAWLIQALLRCSPAEAQALAGEEYVAPLPDDDFGRSISKLLGTPQPVLPDKPPSFPIEFKPLRRERKSAQPFFDYLCDERGYSPAGADWLAKTYGLHYALHGEYRYRLIVPVWTDRGVLASWTGRTICGDVVRYKTLTGHAPNRWLLGLPQLLHCPNARVLVVCEGPFDAFRISSLGAKAGVYGTCLFGLNMSDAQVAQLDRLLRRFSRLVLLLDPDAARVAWRLTDQLRMQQPLVGKLPAGVKDPGELEPEDAVPLVREWLGLS